MYLCVYNKAIEGHSKLLSYCAGYILYYSTYYPTGLHSTYNPCQFHQTDVVSMWISWQVHTAKYLKLHQPYCIGNYLQTELPKLKCKHGLMNSFMKSVPHTKKCIMLLYYCSVYYFISHYQCHSSSHPHNSPIISNQPDSNMPQ